MRDRLIVFPEEAEQGDVVEMRDHEVRLQPKHFFVVAAGSVVVPQVRADKRPVGIRKVVVRIVLDGLVGGLQRAFVVPRNHLLLSSVDVVPRGQILRSSFVVVSPGARAR